MFRWACLSVLLFAWCLQDAKAQNRMPRENVIDVPAMGDGLCASNLFQSNMVLQREKPIVIWGWAKVGEEVTAEFAGASAVAKAGEDRRWQVELPACEASDQPRVLSIRGEKATIELDNILVGDVWILGGQSNMEFPLDRVENGQLEIVSANYPKIRILTVPAADGPDKKLDFPRLHEWSSWFGRHYRKGDWDTCSPEVVRELSAIGYVFARRVHMASQIPIGVIDASRGGTTVETWTPIGNLQGLASPQVDSLLKDWESKVADWDAEADLANRKARYKQRVANFEKEGRQLPPNEKEPDDLRPGPSMDKNRPGNCYASMIAPLEGLAVKGAIFHQGYNNCFNGTEGAIMYGHVFPEMIRSWRTAFRDPDMPFGILSLCTEGPVQTLENFSEMMANPGPYIREAQYKTFLDLYRAGDRNVGFVSTYDLRRRWYHPQLKVPAGERIARWALATQYGLSQQIRWKPPIVESVEIDGDELTLKLDEAAAAVDNGGPILGFAIAGEDRKFHPASAEHLVIDADNGGKPKKDLKTIVLTSPMVPRPLHYRYAWARSPLGNLQASRMTDVPFATQRSDDWPLEAVPAGVFDGDAPSKLDRKQKRLQQEALRTLDVERKKQQLEALLGLDVGSGKRTR